MSATHGVVDASSAGLADAVHRTRRSWLMRIAMAHCTASGVVTNIYAVRCTHTSIMSATHGGGDASSARLTDADALDDLGSADAAHRTRSMAEAHGIRRDGPVTNIYAVRCTHDPVEFVGWVMSATHGGGDASSARLTDAVQCTRRSWLGGRRASHSKRDGRVHCTASGVVARRPIDMPCAALTT